MLMLGGGAVMLLDTGFRRSPADHRDWVLGATVPLAAPKRVPRSYMVDRRNPLTPYNQGSVPSCVGWSLATLKTVQERKDQRRTLAFDGLAIYAPIALPGGGAYIRAGLDHLRKTGAPANNGKAYTISGYAGVVPKDHDAVKAAIVAHRGVLIGFEVTFGWAQGGGDEFRALAATVPAETAPDTVIGAHAMYVPGYDPAGPMGLNTWGMWSGDGRKQLPWDYWDAHVFEVWTVLDTDD
jgi:hypothetical protein